MAIKKSKQKMIIARSSYEKNEEFKVVVLVSMSKYVLIKSLFWQSCLHFGQLFCAFWNQNVIHLVWKTWPHFVVETAQLDLKGSIQIEQLISMLFSSIVFVYNFYFLLMPNLKLKCLFGWVFLPNIRTRQKTKGGRSLVRLKNTKVNSFRY